VIERAEAGDATCTKLCIERVFPVCRERPVRFALPPIEKPADVLAAIQSVTASAAEGAITPSEAGPPRSGARWQRARKLRNTKADGRPSFLTLIGKAPLAIPHRLGLRAGFVAPSGRLSCLPEEKRRTSARAAAGSTIRNRQAGHR
jgi:hypothetical protein